jgi:hypothetical protein
MRIRINFKKGEKRMGGVLNPLTGKVKTTEKDLDIKDLKGVVYHEIRHKGKEINKEDFKDLV